MIRIATFGLAALWLFLACAGCGRTRDEQYYSALVMEEAALKMVKAGLQSDAFSDAERVHIERLVETAQSAREQFKTAIFDLEKPDAFVYLDVLEGIAFQLQQYGAKARERGVAPPKE